MPVTRFKRTRRTKSGKVVTEWVTRTSGPRTYNFSPEMQKLVADYNAGRLSDKKKKKKTAPKTSSTSKKVYKPREKFEKGQTVYFKGDGNSIRYKVVKQSTSESGFRGGYVLSNKYHYIGAKKSELTTVKPKKQR